MQYYLAELKGMNSTFIFTRIYCLGILLILTIEHQNRVKYFKSPLSTIKQSELLPFKSLNINVNTFNLLWCLILCSLSLSILTIFPRFMLVLSAVLLFLYFRSIIELSNVLRKPNHVFLILFSLAFLPDWSLAEYSESSNYVLPLVLVILSQMYFSSALEKLRKTGWKWTDGNSLKYFLLRNYLIYEQPQTLWLSQSPKSILSFFSMVTLTFEATFFLTIFYHNLIPIYLLIGFLFHSSTAIFMRIDYIRLVIWSYLGVMFIFWKLYA